MISGANVNFQSFCTVGVESRDVFKHNNNLLLSPNIMVEEVYGKSRHVSKY